MDQQRGVAGVEALASSSDQISWRRPVRALMTSTGWSGSNDRAMSVIGTAPVLAKAAGVSSPGTLVTIGAPGLKPSDQL